MTPVTTLRETRLPALDGVRGLAILGPLAERFNLSTTGGGPIQTVFCLIADHGWIGVQLFFVLSGFLITGILLDSRDKPSYFRTFYVRRLLRIVPLYYATLVVTLLLLPLLTSSPLPDGRQIWLWLFLVNWSQALGGETFELPHFWSLAVEEQFYLVWPLVVLLLTPRRLGDLCVLLVIAAFASRWWLAVTGTEGHVIYVLTHCRMDALALGALGALALRSTRAREFIGGHIGWLLFTAGTLALLGAALTSGFSRETLPGQTAGYLALGIVFLIFVVAAAASDLNRSGTPFARLLRQPGLRMLGKYSYGMYVLHVPVDRLLKPWFQQWGGTDSPFGQAILYMAFAGAATLAVARVAFIVIERPFLRMKGELAPYGNTNPA